MWLVPSCAEDFHAERLRTYRKQKRQPRSTPRTLLEIEAGQLNNEIVPWSFLCLHRYPSYRQRGGTEKDRPRVPPANTDAVKDSRHDAARCGLLVITQRTLVHQHPNSSLSIAQNSSGDDVPVAVISVFVSIWSNVSHRPILSPLLDTTAMNTRVDSG